MNSSIKGLSGVIAFVVAFAVVRYGLFNSSATIDSELIKACNEINKNCPMTVDANTRLDNATSINKKITYFYTILDLPDDAVVQGQDEIKKIVSDNARNNKDTSKLLKNGVEMEYVYRNKDAKELFRFSVR